MIKYIQYLLGIMGKSNAFYIHTCIFITSWSCLVSSYSPLHPNLEVTRFIVVATYPYVVCSVDGGPLVGCGNAVGRFLM